LSKWIIPLVVGLVGVIVIGMLFSILSPLDNSGATTESEIVKYARTSQDVNDFLNKYPMSHEYVDTKGAVVSMYFVAPSNSSIQTCTDEFCSSILTVIPFVRFTYNTSVQPYENVVYCGLGTLNSDGTIKIEREGRPCQTISS
jgi:hypothetical protein